MALADVPETVPGNPRTMGTPPTRRNSPAVAANTAGASDPFSDHATTLPTGPEPLLPSDSRANVSASSALTASHSEAAVSRRIERFRHQLEAGLISARLSRNARLAHQHVSQRRCRARGVGEVGRIGSRSKRAVLFDGHRRPAVRVLRQRADRFLEPYRIAGFRGKTSAFEEDGEIVRTQAMQFLQEPQRAGVRVLTAGPLDLLCQRVARPQISRVELNRAAEAGDGLIKTSARGVQLPLEKRDVSVRRGERSRAPERLRRPVEIAESEVCEAEVGP